MNLALSAVIIFILLLPPIAFYLSLILVGRFPKAGPKIGLFEGLMLSAIIAAVLHAIVLLFIHREVRFDVLALLVGGDLKTLNEVVSNGTFKVLFQSFVFYCFGLTGLSVAAGIFCRWIVTTSGIHARSEILRLYNNWWYLFRGYRVDGNIDSPNPVEFDIVFIDVLVDTNAGTMLYSGYLLDFVCVGENLDRLYLSEVSKREFKSNKKDEKGNILINEPGDPQEIDGDTMAIPYLSIINMNLHFVTLPEGINDIPEDATITIEPDQTGS